MGTNPLDIIRFIEDQRRASGGVFTNQPEGFSPEAFDPQHGQQSLEVLLRNMVPSTVFPGTQISPAMAGFEQSERTRSQAQANLTNELAAALTNSPDRAPGLSLLLQQILPKEPEPLKPPVRVGGPGDVLFDPANGGQSQIPFEPRPAPTQPEFMQRYLLWRSQGNDGTLEEFERAMAGARAQPQAQIPGRDIPFPEDVAAQRMILNAQRAQVQGLSPTQFTRVQTLASQFDTNPVVKNFNESSLRYQGVKNVVENPGWGGPGDMAVIFEFMRSLDPTSVVRESEYQEAAKAGNIFKGWAARFNGLVKEQGGFLSERVKQDFLRVLTARMQSASKQVKGFYNDFGRRIELITGQPGAGTDYLTDYTQILGDMGGAGGGGQQGGTAPAGEGRTATNPSTGQKLILRNGKWVPL